jgi:hypothetical protein
MVEKGKSGSQRNSGGNSKQRRAERRLEEQNKQKNNKNIQPKPSEIKSVLKPIPYLPPKAQREEQKPQTPQTFREKSRLFTENNLAVGGLGVIITAFGILLGVNVAFSGLLLLTGGLMIIVAVWRYNFFEHKTKSFQQFANFSITAIIFIGLFVAWFYFQPNPPERKLLAFLVPANEPNPPSNCRETSSTTIAAYLGNSVGSTFRDEMTVISAGGEPLLAVKKTFGGLLINLKLYDSKGKEIANIVDNKFVGKVADNLDIQIIDAHSIAIYDKNNNTLLFHIRFLNNRTIKVLGRLYLPNRKSMLFIDEETMRIGSNKLNVSCFADMFEAAFKF